MRLAKECAGVGQWSGSWQADPPVFSQNFFSRDTHARDCVIRRKPGEWVAYYIFIKVSLPTVLAIRGECASIQ